MQQSHQHTHQDDGHNHNQDTPAQPPKQAAAGAPQISIYSTHTCGYCKMEKAWLDEQGINYTNHFVDDDQARADEMIEKSGQMGVPVTIVTLADGSEELVVGFDRPRLAKLIGLEQ